MSKPESNSAKVLISNPVIGLTIVALVAGSLFYIYVIHAHLVHLQLYKSAIIKTAAANERDKNLFVTNTYSSTTVFTPLSEASENFYKRH